MEIKTEIAHIYIDENQFCCIDLDTSKKDNLDAELATELCEAIGKICNGKPTKLLTDSTKAYGFVNSEARDIISNHPDLLKVRQAEAFVIDSLANRLIVKVYLKFDKPNHQVKTFNKREHAIAWLKSLE